MADPVEHLILDLIEWVGRQERTYQETMEAWRTSCPRLPVWEEAIERGLVQPALIGGLVIVVPTAAGLLWLEGRRPSSRGRIPS